MGWSSFTLILRSTLARCLASPGYIHARASIVIRLARSSVAQPPVNKTALSDAGVKPITIPFPHILFFLADERSSLDLAGSCGYFPLEIVHVFFFGAFFWLSFWLFYSHQNLTSHTCILFWIVCPFSGKKYEGYGSFSAPGICLHGLCLG